MFLLNARTHIVSENYSLPQLRSFSIAKHSVYKLPTVKMFGLIQFFLFIQTSAQNGQPFIFVYTWLKTFSALLEFYGAFSIITLANSSIFI